MYDQLLTNLGQGKFLGAFLCLLVFLGGLAAQNKLQPILAKLSPWGRTIALLLITQAGVTASSLDAGIAWYLAIGHALPPIAAVLVAHWFAAPPANDPNGPSAASKMASTAALALGVIVLALGLSISAPGCKLGTLPPVSTGNVTSTIDGGCTVVGILDSSGATAADVCETLAPILSPIIATIINDLGGDKKLATAETSFVPLTRGGAVVGKVRADIASAVQAKLDGVSIPAAAK